MENNITKARTICFSPFVQKNVGYFTTVTLYCHMNLNTPEFKLKAVRLKAVSLKLVRTCHRLQSTPEEPGHRATACDR